MQISRNLAQPRAPEKPAPRWRDLLTASEYANHLGFDRAHQKERPSAAMRVETGERIADRCPPPQARPFF